MKKEQVLKGKTAIVTGGAQGLGEAISLRLAHEGCNVVIADINQKGIQETEERIQKQFGAQTLGIVTDVKQELREVGAFKINYSTAKQVAQRR